MIKNIGNYEISCGAWNWECETSGTCVDGTIKTLMKNSKADEKSQNAILQLMFVCFP